MIRLNLQKNLEAQDMIRIIMRDKNLSVKGAIDFAINRDMHQNILKAGYASIALDLWGHDDLERKWDILDNPVFDLELDKLRQRLVEDISERQHVDVETAICYFLIFTMDYLGYHI
ncbi:hypothetical protein [uncultured Phascolarctobacterium sp.]|uniref:hypothetical protein n=1 Tax=uncultured Phascolarctobacterium sp. TaxID=512296 RepID=UPI0025EDE4BA|nr:hypothetical protein [uncultured Phascolarctobacterium sp.]